MDNISNFVELKTSNKIWAIGSIHSNLNSFKSIKEFILNNFELNDKLVSKKYSLVNEKLIDAFEFDLPNSLVNKHEDELKQQYASFKQTDNDVDEKIKDIATKRVKLNMIYIKLAKEIKTNISDQEAIDFCNDQSPAFRQFYGEKLKKD